MAHPYHHALSSARRYGGSVEDYLEVHAWFDESKAFVPDFRHRALRHHAEGIFLCERLFGASLTNSVGRIVPVRYLGEQHVKEDLGRIPTASDWLRCLQPEPWMTRTRNLERELAQPLEAAPGITPASALSVATVRAAECFAPDESERRVDAGVGRCLHCRSDEMAHGPYRADGDGLTEDVTCLGCRRRWRRVYTLCRIDALEAESHLQGD